MQHHGPYQLLGYSGGGSSAYKIARQLEAAGEEVALHAAIDHALHAAPYERTELSLSYVGRFAANPLRRLPFTIEVGRQFGMRRRWRPRARG